MEEVNKLSFSAVLDLPFAEVVRKTTEALKEEGFGVLTEIDLKATFKKKLDRDFRNYTILGACNPPFAYQSLTTDLDVGLLLPCNVVVYETDQEKVQVSAINPLFAMQVIQNDRLKDLAAQVTAKIKNAIDRLKT